MTEEQSKIAISMANILNVKSYSVRDFPEKIGLSGWFDFLTSTDAEIFAEQMNKAGIPTKHDKYLLGIAFINWV